jgi:hypothetical protein
LYELFLAIRPILLPEWVQVRKVPYINPKTGKRVAVAAASIQVMVGPPVFKCGRELISLI